MSTRIGVNGAGGRMGARLIQLAQEDPELRLAAALERADHPGLGRDIGEVLQMGALGVPLSAVWETAVDVMIDFSSPEATRGLVAACLERATPLVIGTTGLGADLRRLVDEASHQIPVLVAPNMSLGVHVLGLLVRQAAELLADGFDVEIIERHHRFKKDAPSGTALRLADQVRAAQPSRQYVYGRQGLPGPRRPEELGLHAVRAGDVVGEHTVIFSSLGETIELTHKAHSRDCFARGALRAAKFLAGQKPGLYAIDDVLGRR